MPLPKKYLPLPSPAVATINYIDLAEGITIFNACTAEKNTGEQYFLTTGVPYSHLVSFSGGLGTNATLSGSFNSGVLNRPMLIKGNAYVNVTWRVTNSTGSNNNFVFAELRRYDGSTYTKLGEISGSVTNSANGAIKTTLLQIANIASTLIKTGEQISVNVGITGADAGSTPRGHIACDPQNRDDDWFTTGNFDTTKLQVGIPTKIN